MVKLTILISLIAMQSVAFCQDRDSVALQLYRSGKITKEAYYKTRPKTEIIAEGKRLVNELRDKLPYKFPQKRAR